ncbi:MAG: adenylate/guanylate cyclase domain-containing protein [Xenophilus sp.]
MTTTVVFADLTGSTRAFEIMGNARATETVTRLIQWIGRVCEAHEGRVVKKLGDGVLAIFTDGACAIEAVLEMQRNHLKRLQNWPAPLRMELQIGVASGEVLQVEGDSYGDAVNVASRLSDLAGPAQIWATDSVIAQLRDVGVRHRRLGPIHIRGRTEMPVVHRVDWQEGVTEFLTMPSPLMPPPRGTDSNFGQIELSWLDVRSMFTAEQLPIHLGRVDEAEFVVNDPRVSRLHARLEARNGSCVLIDISTYGTWVRFHDRVGASSEIALRREECVLHGSGEIGLGAPLSEIGAPSIAFSTRDGNLLLSQRRRV